MMDNILVAFTGEKTRQSIANLFQSSSFSVGTICSTGMEILEQCRNVKSGVVICGYSLYDMSAEELCESLPKGFSMAVLAEEAQLAGIESSQITKVMAPVRQETLLETVRQMLTDRAAVKPQYPQRSEADKQLIADAKLRIMERNALSEEQAYRFIQKKSMDMGAKMVDTARRILGGEIAI